MTIQCLWWTVDHLTTPVNNWLSYHLRHVTWEHSGSDPDETLRCPCHTKCSCLLLPRKPSHHYRQHLDAASPNSSTLTPLTFHTRSNHGCDDVASLLCNPQTSYCFKWSSTSIYPRNINGTPTSHTSPEQLPLSTEVRVRDSKHSGRRHLSAARPTAQRHLHFQPQLSRATKARFSSDLQEFLFYCIVFRNETGLWKYQ